MTLPVPDRRLDKPVEGGDYITTPDGLYGVVKEFEVLDGIRIAVIWEQDLDDIDDLVVTEHRVPVAECTPLHGQDGSFELCEAIERNVVCDRWAVRSVTSVPLGQQAPDEKAAERRAVCWHHLPAAVYRATHRFAPVPTEVRLGDVVGGTEDSPVGIEHVRLGTGWGRRYDQSGSPRRWS